MSEAARDSTPHDPALPQSAPPTLIRAYKSPSAWALFLIPAILGVIADLAFKAWSFPDHVGRLPFTIIPHVLEFVTTTNKGMVFGIGQGKVAIFEAFSWLALAIILWVFATSDPKHRVVHIALGLITAGAIGNLYDRAIHHGVRDMLKFICFHFRPLTLFGFRFPSGPIDPDGTLDWYPYIFNLADVFLCVGVPLLIARWLFIKDPEPAAQDPTPPPNAANK